MALSNSDFANIVDTVRSTAAATLEPESKKFNDSAMAVEKSKKPKRVYTKAEKEKRETKKASYLEYKKTMDELTAKYRDRAKERRQGDDVTGQEENNKTLTELQALTRATQASIIAKLPTNQQSITKTKRKLLIEDSKFLGGDIEHTHLVKGLDYALLRKKRMEMAEEDAEKEAELAKLVDAHKQASQNLQRQVLYNSPLARRICEGAMAADPRWAKEARSAAAVAAAEAEEKAVKKKPKINRLFLPGRMAWVFDTTRKGSCNPTSIIRSEIEVSTADRERANAIEKQEREGASTNDIVIDKLIQILSYIRSGENSKLQKKRKTIEMEEKYQESQASGREKVDEGYSRAADDEDRDGSSRRRRDKSRDRSRTTKDKVKDERRNRSKERERTSSKRNKYRDYTPESDEERKIKKEKYYKSSRDQRDSRREDYNSRDRHSHRDESSKTRKLKRESEKDDYENRKHREAPRFEYEETEVVTFAGSGAVDDEYKKYERSKSKKRSKRMERSKSPANVQKQSSHEEKRQEVEKASDSGSDIFSDVGEYVCESKKKKEADRSGFIKPSEFKKIKAEKLSEMQKQHFDTTDIENSLPSAPKKLKTTTTSDDIIAQAKKMANDKKFGLKNEDDETEVKRKKLNLPTGSVAFGKADMDTYGAEYDDDDRMDDEMDVMSSSKVKSGRMNERSFVNQQWQQVNSIIEKNNKAAKK